MLLLSCANIKFNADKQKLADDVSALFGFTNLLHRELNVNGLSLVVIGDPETVRARVCAAFPQYSIDFLRHAAYLPLHPQLRTGTPQGFCFDETGELTFNAELAAPKNYVFAESIRTFGKDVLSQYRLAKLTLLLDENAEN